MAEERRCPRCGTPVPPSKSVCQRCEQPIRTSGRRAARAGRQPVLYNPAGLALPSPVQGHATVMVGIGLALVVLVVVAFTALGGVGPFRAEVVGRRAAPVGTGGGGVIVDLRVTNTGSRAGRAKCRVTGGDGDGVLHDSPVVVTDRIEAGGSAALRLPVERVGVDSALTVTCG